ncbi:MAG: 2-hydroxyglutaryl-CoA dehydratase [archaeon]|nr:2-hydroxyglutaryl-CoA dehydratase [archaeon]
MVKELFLGIDVGSVSVKIILTDQKGKLYKGLWLRNEGSPIVSVKKGLAQLKEELVDEKKFDEIKILALGTTGSARYLIKSVVGGDIAKTEIIAHAVATSTEFPDVNTILEIGGQDSKIILLRDGIISDFAMNSVCAAGTGSFLDHQAQRLNIPIEDFGDYAKRSETPVAIAGRCTVFAESDMVHKQQMGYSKEDIIRGLCNSLVRNYLNNVGKGKEIKSPIVFQGGVSANAGIVKAFGEQLGVKVKVPEHYILMGAIGASYLAKEYREKALKAKGKFETKFRGFNVLDIEFKTSAFNCKGCPNQCEIVQIMMDNEESESEIVARWGDRCGKWEVF